MAEHNRDRMDQAQDAVRERNIVRDGGIARSDADIERRQPRHLRFRHRAGRRR